MDEPTKRGRGRPRKGPERKIKLPAPLWGWLRAQGRDYSDTIRMLIEKEIAAMTRVAYIQHAKSGETYAAELVGDRITSISEPLTTREIAENDPADFDMEPCEQPFGHEWAGIHTDDIKRRAVTQIEG